MSDRSGRPASEDASAPGMADSSTRRSFLSGIGSTAAATTAVGSKAAAGGAGALGSLAGLAGCVSLGATSGSIADESRPVKIFAAGSLQRTFGDALREAVDVPITVEAHGSVTAARLVANGHRDPDVLALADTALFESLLDVPWYATVATNALVVAHGDGADSHPISTASEWFDPVLAGEVTLGRTDPALDPLGYRTVFGFELGERYYDHPGLTAALLAASSIYPETSLVSRLESGAVDAAIVYRNMAVERDYPTVALPPAIDLSDHARDYSDATYALEDGTTVHGAPIRYGAWARSGDERVRDVFATITEGSVLGANGFGVAGSLPTYHGQAPAELEV